MSAVIALITELKEKGIQLSLAADQQLTVKGHKSHLTAALLAQIKVLKPQLLACLQVQAAQETKPVIRTRADLSGPAITSFAQQRLWLIDQIDGQSSHYNMPVVLHLRGMIDVKALHVAFTQLLQRHESLRTCFALDDAQQPVQVIQPATDFMLAFRDLVEFNQLDRQQQLESLINSERQSPFDLTQDLMLRARLLRVGVQEYYLLVTMHHIAADGWSLGIFIDEFQRLYQAASTQKTADLAPLAIQYADYAVWQRSYLTGPLLQNQLAYWTEMLADLPTVHQLPLDYPRPAIQSFIGNTFQTELSAEVTTALKLLCLKTEATLFMGLHAAFSVLLARYSNDVDIVIGTPTANRDQPEIAGLIGFFVNNLVLRSDLSGEPTYLSLLQQSRDHLLRAYQHQQVPFELIVERLKPERNLSYSPLFQIMLTLQQAHATTFSLAEAAAELLTSPNSMAKYDLTLNVEEGEKQLVFNWEYNVDLFAPSTIVAMANNFMTLLAAFTAEPQQNVFALPMLAEQQRQHLDEWNQTTVPLAQDLCIHQLFERMVSQYPAHIAVVTGDNSINYQQLNSKSNQLAHYLRQTYAIEPDHLVGICFDRSIEMVIGILAILKAGGAYVPLDPNYPISRLSDMVDDAQVRLILTTSNVKVAQVFQQHLILHCDNCWTLQNHQEPDFSDYSKANLDRAVTGLTPTSLAYVIYTSGSTGRPKGVMIEHRNLINYQVNIEKRYAIEPKDHVLQFSTVCFDIFVEELFGALCHGARLILRDEECLQNAQSFNLFCQRHQVSIISLPTAFWHQINAHHEKINSPTLQKIIVGGEALSKTAVEQYFAKVKHISLINTYGPTETTITATGFLLDTTTEVQERIPIGRANANHQLYILNSSKQLCPIGVVGELYIGGEGLARGYLNQPELTKSVFIKHVLVNGQNQRTEHRLYKTGDLVKCLPNGQVVFIGRVDDQVKIRGFRVELGEIANQIMDLPSVASAMVLTKLSQLGDQKLVAYIKQRQVQLSTVKPIAAEQQQQLCSAIQQHLTAVLPNYMVPKSFVVIDEWPLTPNGKVDKKALLTLPELSIARADIPPVSETAMQLAQLWASLLQLDPANISNSANFFELGGHSLLIGHLTNKISQVFGCDLSIVDIYQHQKLNEMAQLLLNFTKPSSAAVEKAQDPYLIHLKVGAPEFPAVFLVPPVGGNITQFIALSGMMDFPGAVYSFDARLVNAESIKEMAAVYVAAILTVQPQGRYFVGGWSMGGVVALEIANQLKADGGQVPTVLMIDSFAPMLSSHEDISAERQTDFTDELVRQFVKELELTIVDSDLVSLQVLAKDAIEPLLSALLEIAKQQRKLPQDYPLQELLTRYQLYARDSRMLHAHRPSYFDGAIALIRASDNRHPDPQLGWERYVASIEVSEAPGDHFSMFSPANITDLATQLNTKMAAWMA